MLVYLKNNQKFLKNIFILLAFIAFLLIVAKHYSSVSFKYLQVLDETHSYGATKLLYEGKNPYILSNYPNYFNMYGIVFPFLSAQLAKLFGLSITLLRLVNVASVIILLLIFSFIFKNEINKKPLFSIVLLLILYNGCMWGWLSVARPDMLGSLFYCISILIPFKLKFSRVGLVISAIFAILSFYTKIYFLSGAIFLFIWLIFSHKYNLALFYSLLTGLFGIISALLINAKYPLYFYESVFSGIGGIGSISESAKKIILFCLFISPILLIFVAHYRDWKKFKKSQFIHNPFLFIGALALILLIYLGTHSGGSLNYHLTLLLPLVIAGLLYEDSITLYFNKLPILILSTILLIVGIILQKPYLRKTKDDSNWVFIENYLKDKNDVLNSCLVAGILINQNKYVYEIGASSYGFAKAFKPKPLTMNLFGQDSLIQKRITYYFENIKLKGRKKMFDAIVIDQGMLEKYEIDTLHYKLISEKKLYIPKSDLYFPVLIYEPK